MNKKAVLHLVNEFTPIATFYIASQFFSFFIATGTLVTTTIIALSLGWFYERRFPAVPIVSGIFVIISGGITLLYHAPDALILGDSLYYFSMSLAILFGLFFKINLLKKIFSTTFAMQDEGWNILAKRWIIIFALSGIANEIARFYLTPEEWVHFKFIKVLSITIFGFYQFTLSRRYRIPEESNSWGLRKDKVVVEVPIPN